MIGLYLSPPQHAAVFCVDEKTAIQALDRLDTVLPLSPGRVERHGFAPAGGKLLVNPEEAQRVRAIHTNKYVFKFLGGFAGEARKKYVVEVNFTKDGTPLNVANPHLIVTKQGDE